MKEKIKSFEKYKNEAVLFLAMLFIAIFRFPFSGDVLHAVYGESLLTNVCMRFGIVKHLDNFDRGIYTVCVFLSIAVFITYFVISCSLIKKQNGKEKDRATYISMLLFVVPANILSVFSRDNFSVVILSSVLIAGLCIVFCQKEKMAVFLPILLALATVISPVCACIVFSMIFYPMRYEVKNRRKQSLIKPCYIVCQIEYVFSVLMIVCAFFETPYFVKESFVHSLITVLLCIPVTIPFWFIIKGFEEKNVLLIPLISLPVVLAGTDLRLVIMCTLCGIILSVMYVFRYKKQSLVSEIDKVFKWFDKHMFVMCFYMIYCCVLSFSSLGTMGKLAASILRYIVL